MKMVRTHSVYIFKPYTALSKNRIRIYGFLWSFWNGPRIRVSSILVLVVQVTMRIRRRSICFLQIALRKNWKNQVPTSYITRFAVEFFCPTSCSSQESEGFIFRQATYKGTYVEAVESAMAGLSPKKRGCEKEKKKTKEICYIIALFDIR